MAAILAPPAGGAGQTAGMVVGVSPRLGPPKDPFEPRDPLDPWRGAVLLGVFSGSFLVLELLEVALAQPMVIGMTLDKGFFLFNFLSLDPLELEDVLVSSSRFFLGGTAPWVTQSTLTTAKSSNPSAS